MPFSVSVEKSRSIRRSLVVGNVLAAILILMATAFVVISDRQKVIEDSTADVTMVRNAISEQTQQTFSALALALGSIVDVIDPRNLSDPDVHNVLRIRQAVLSFSYAIYILDHTGQLVSTSRTPSPAPEDFSNDPAFTKQKSANIDGLFIAPPRLGKVGYARDRWVIPVSRRLTHVDGRFAGVVAAVVSLDHLTSFYETLRLGKNGTVGLINLDTTILARSPHDPDYLGQTIAETKYLRGELPTGPSGVFRTIQNSDDTDRIYAYARIPDYPLAVYIGISVDERLAAWRVRAVLDTGSAVLAIAIMIGLSALLAARLRQGVAEQARRVEQLKQLARVSELLFEADSVDTAIQRATDIAREVVPSHMAVLGLTQHTSMAQEIYRVSLSDRYANWRDYRAVPDGSGIYSRICHDNQPIRLTQAELLAHPEWKGFGDAAEHHPPMRGWLAVPLLDENGKNLGLLQLSDRVEGDFTSEDEALLLDLAHTTSAAIQRLKLSDELRIALRRSDRLRLTAEAARNAEITTRREVETILTSIRDAMVALDRDWRFTFINPRGEELLERTREELVGTNVWAEFPEIIGTVVEKECKRAQTEQTDVTFEYHNPRLRRWFDVRAFPQAGGGVTVYFLDVTEWKDKEEQLRQSQKMEAVGQLTGGLAHDFNNLLTVIIGNTELLLDSTDASDPRYRQLSLIDSAAERAASLTERLLAFSRRQPLDPKSVDVDGLIHEIEPLLKTTAGARSTVIIEGGAEGKCALVDPVQLQNALINLVSNARDAMPDGGQVRIVTEVVDQRNAPVSSEQGTPDSYVAISVTDTGVGMSPDVQARAFEPFFTTKQVGEGTGLGLSMVFGFARQSEGNVTICSDIGKGTAITLYLPISEMADDNAAKPASVSRNDHARGRILVVEDDEMVRDLLVATTAMMGYQSKAVPDGLSAVSELASGPSYDLVLCDVILGGPMNGWEVAEAARKANPNQKVLFMSGFTDEVIMRDGRLVDNARLLRKPFRRAELEKSLADVLSTTET